MGRNKYSQHEFDIISMLLRKKCAGTRFQQKIIRHQLRVNFDFNISDFNEQGKAFGPDELRDALNRGAITIVDDATAAAMKARYAEMRQREAADDEALRQQAIDKGEQTDWQQALKEWEEWETGNKPSKE